MPDTTIIDESLYSPYLAAIEGRDEIAQKKFFEQFAEQTDEVRHFVTSMDTFTAVKQLVDSGTVPTKYAVAMAKIIALVAVGEVDRSQLGGLLEKLGLSPEEVTIFKNAILTVLAPISSTAHSNEKPPLIVKEMPPLSRPSENGPKPLVPGIASPNVPQRNIIDLRHKTE